MSFKNLLKSQAGMSLVEMTLVAGLMATAGLGLLSLADNLGNSSRRAEAIVARTQFISGLNAYLSSHMGCEDIKDSRLGGGALSASSSDIKLTKWNYLGLTTIRGGVDPSGRKFTPFKYFTLEKLEGYVVPIADAPSVNARKMPENVPEVLVRSMMNIGAIIKMDNRVWKHLFNVPVLVDSSGGIQFCGDEKTLVESCSAIKGIYNPAAKECELDDACQFRDTYTTLTCSQAPCDLKLGGVKLNKYTGQQSCPPGSNAVPTHATTWTSKVSCGKKCTTDVSNNMAWFTCMACPE